MTSWDHCSVVGMAFGFCTFTRYRWKNALRGIGLTEQCHLEINDPPVHDGQWPGLVEGVSAIGLNV